MVQNIVDQVRSGREIPNIEDAMTAIRDLQRIAFDVPDRTDSDGSLFHYEKVNWFPDPTFVVEPVRQLEIADIDGERKAFSQVQLEYRYRVDSDLDPIQGIFLGGSLKVRFHSVNGSNQ
ncbi:hypothetical protein ACIRQP_41600 [Streptomyces sp. NPDC102274]|uniref:hypothetical protein n=1 Tax=Streptomyces sp. NPDC102274 TaxID=3366151 RepID=UPI0038298883